MLTYLFDTSAVIDIYLPPRSDRVRKILTYILQQREIHHKAMLYIPNICVAEVFNTFARRRFRPKDSNDAIDQEMYETCLKKFRKDIHWGKRLYVYDLNRYHITAVDEIIPTEHHVQRDETRAWDNLSTADILVIAMSCELVFQGNREDTFLVTCDKRIKKVAEQLGERNPNWKVPGPLDDPGPKRWVAPLVLYPPSLDRDELRKVDNQAPINL